MTQKILRIADSDIRELFENSQLLDEEASHPCFSQARTHAHDPGLALQYFETKIDSIRSSLMAYEKSLEAYQKTI